MNSFEIEAVELLHIKKVLVGHDHDHPGDGWFLKKIVIRDKDNLEQEFIFYHNRYWCFLRN